MATKKDSSDTAKKTEDTAAKKDSKKDEKKAKKETGQKIRVIIRAFDHKIADESAKTIIDTAERTGSLVTGPIPLPTKIEKFTINRSTFVNKDAREQFEIRTHKRLIDMTIPPTPSSPSPTSTCLPESMSKSRWCKHPR